MATQIQPEFSGSISEDFATLVELLRSEVRVAAGRSEPFSDTFSLGVNDGISMLVSRSAADAVESGSADPCREYNLEGLVAAQEHIETQYWTLESAGLEAFDAEQLASLDQQVLDLYDQAAPKGDGASLIAGAHARFAGDASRPTWSLFIQNEGLRKIACSADASAAVFELFSPSSQGDSGVEVVFMSTVSPYPPLCLSVSRAVLQLRAQCLNPAGIILTRRGLALRAASPEQLWEYYCAITQTIAKDVRSRLRKMPWIFQGAGEMLPESLLEPALEALESSMGEDVSLKCWPSSREGVLRKALCSPELVDVIEKGFPDLHTAGLGGLRPLVVKLQDNESPKSVGERITAAWNAYSKDLSEDHPLLPRGAVHLPYVIVLANLGVVTTLADPTAAQAAYSALAESVSVLEGTRAYGGMTALVYAETLPLAASPLRRPSAADAVGVGLVDSHAAVGDDESPDEFEDDVNEGQAGGGDLSVRDIRIKPPGGAVS